MYLIIGGCLNSLIYRLSYWLGLANWDSGRVPLEVEQAIQLGEMPEGHALDLGCGTGASVIYMAKHGRKSIGIDFVPQAIARAKAKAQRASVSSQTQFIVADATHLEKLNLPHCAFALDMGCFHGLDPEGQQRYARGLADLMLPGGRFLLYVLDPRKELGVSYGISVEKVRSVFEPWLKLEKTERGSFWDRNSTWFWMRKDVSKGLPTPMDAQARI
jgi:SAM-dependent methyltransferase